MTWDMKDSGVKWIGDMPASWGLRRSGQLAEQIKQPNDGLVEMNLLSLSYGRIKRRDINSSEGLIPASYETYNIVEPDDIVLRFTDLQNDQKSLRVGLVLERGIITSAYTTIRPHDPGTARFLYYALHAYDLKKGFYGMGAGVRQGLKWQEAKYILLPWPDATTRARIADYLDAKCTEVDTAISHAEASISEHELYEQALIAHTVNSGVNADAEMVPSGNAFIGSMPNSWPLVRFKHVAFFLNGDRSARYPSGDDIVSDGIPFVTSAELNGRHLSHTFSKHITQMKYDSLGGVRLHIDDVVYCLRGSVGKCALNVQEDEGTVASSLTVARPKGCNPSWLNYALASSSTLNQAVATAIGATSQNLAANMLAQAQVPLPNLDEQLLIADYLDSKCAAIDCAIAQKQSIIDDLKAYKQSLIYEVVTGKKEV